MISGHSFARFDGLSAIPPALRGGVVAIGNFDGCHKGHQQVFDAALAMARKKGVPAIVLTFEPHPRDVFAEKPFVYRLTYADSKARLAQAAGFDAIVVMAFSRDIAALEPGDFVTRHLVDALGASGVVVGADFHFGRARAGTPQFLATEGAAHGFAVEICPMLDADGVAVSSSRIRQALEAGDLLAANALLGYRHFFSGTVVDGDRRGRALGYPTANIKVPDTFALRHGVYAVKARIEGEVLAGVAAFGKPMFGDVRPPFETYLFDFSRDIYGLTIEIALIDFLRGQMIFDGLDGLISQMGRDSAAARGAIARARPLSGLDAALGFVS